MAIIPLQGEAYLRRMVQLNLQLAVAKNKYLTLAMYAESLCSTILDNSPALSEERILDDAKKLQAVMRELENAALNLH